MAELVAEMRSRKRLKTEGLSPMLMRVSIVPSRWLHTVPLVWISSMDTLHRLSQRVSSVVRIAYQSGSPAKADWRTGAVRS